jgi:hypothetical protein
VNKKRESRHILGDQGGNMDPREVKFQGVSRGRGANEGGGGRQSVAGIALPVVSGGPGWL